MRSKPFTLLKLILILSPLSLFTSCATTTPVVESTMHTDIANVDYTSRMPATYNTYGEKVVLINPNVHAWGAYSADGQLVRAGIATSGGSICPPEDSDGGDCRTGIGTFRITSLGDADCYSKKYPRPNGGGLMPYCMFFNNGEALHGSPDSIVVENNISHGCVRMRIPDAEWMRYNFATVGTKVVVVPYS